MRAFSLSFGRESPEKGFPFPSLYESPKKDWLVLTEGGYSPEEGFFAGERSPEKSSSSY